jgi:hydrogenase maturation protease
MEARIMIRERGKNRVVVIGYGNSMRGDDGAGRRVADFIECEAIAQVIVISTTQLLPEIAAEVALARGAIFVDACEDPELMSVRVQELEPAAGMILRSHHLGPGHLLQLAEQCFGHAPRAWIVSLPAREFGLSAELSPVATKSVESAVGVVTSLIRSVLETEVAHA